MQPEHNPAAAYSLAPEPSPAPLPAADDESVAAPGGIPSPEPLPANVRGIQPGGGLIQQLELAWGELRRWRLKKFHPRYVEEMQSLRRGDPTTCPVEVIDSRDLKHFRNQTDCHFLPEDDPYAWRDHTPLARAGHAELLVSISALLALVWFLHWTGGFWPALLPLMVAAIVVAFFRDPHRMIPKDPMVVVSPADGKIVALERVENHEYLGEPAWKIAIFLSVLDVHVNRIPRAARVIRVRYQPGKFTSALLDRSADENERLDAYLVETEPPHRRFVVRQIAGSIARRIVCELTPGQEVATGQRYGMIKFGSRVELLLPARDFEPAVKHGDSVSGGATVLGRYRAPEKNGG